MGLVYVGNGAFLPGVPARDLSADEVQLHGGEKRLLESRLYVKPSMKPHGTENKVQVPGETKEED